MSPLADMVGQVLLVFTVPSDSYSLRSLSSEFLISEVRDLVKTSNTDSLHIMSVRQSWHLLPSTARGKLSVDY